jgi:hypothetical protein
MTEAEMQRRVCWMIRTCLMMPVWHPAQVYRLPELAGELAAHVGRRSLGRPN